MIELRDLVCGYGDTPVVTVPRLQLAGGEVVALIGRSGSGKSTLLATLAGSLTPLSGEILVDGVVRDGAWLGRHVARTLQSFPLLHWLTVRENLRLAARLRGQDAVDAVGVLKRFAADHLADRYPKSLSGGERARASLAQATTSRPLLLLLDEPLTGLDPVVKEEVANALFGFARTEGAAVFFVTHDLGDAARYCTRAAILERGSPGRIEVVVRSDEPNVEDHMLTVLRQGQ